MLAVLLLVLAEGAEVVNGGFDQALDGWTFLGAGATAEAVELEGRTAAHLIVPSETPVGWPHLQQDFPATPGMAYEAVADAMQRGITDGQGAYVSVEFHGSSGKRISYGQSDFAGVEGRWAHLTAYGIAPEGCTTVRLGLILYGHGEAWFDSVTMTAAPGMDATPPQLNGPVTISVTGEVACDNLKGFGAEDDGWFYNPENASHGVDDADAALREKRTEWMSPDYVRMFCWYKEWNPSSDWESFTFDSDHMLSRYRTLDVYQRLGTTINLTGVEWGVEAPYAEPEKLAKALGALFEQLIKVKGYTCVREWTLTNEPNTNWTQRGGTFDKFVKIHQLVKAEFSARGLDVKVVGSDDTAGETWFRQCVEDPAYFETADVFASHRYFPFADRGLATRFYDERLGLLRGKTPAKPFVVGEFGFQDARSGVVDNPLMEEYRYAIWTAAFAIEGLNAGVAGFSIWSIHEMYYPTNTMMNYALWNYKDRGWSLRPVFYTWANFCRLTKSGDKVYRCTSSHPKNVSAAKVGDVLFWVNCGEGQAQVQLDGMQAREVHVWTEGPCGGVTETGSVLGEPASTFRVPGMSFGFCR